MGPLMVLVVLNLLAILLALVISGFILYFLISLREQVFQLVQRQKAVKSKTTGIHNNQDSIATQVFTRESCSSLSGRCNKPDPMEEITRVPSPKSLRKQFQGFSRRFRARQKCSSSSTGNSAQNLRNPSPSLPCDRNIFQVQAEELRDHNRESPYARNNNSDFPQNIDWPSPDETVSPTLPPKSRETDELNAVKHGARRKLPQSAVYGNSESRNKFLYKVSSDYDNEITEDDGGEIRDTNKGYVNNNELVGLRQQKAKD